MQKILVTLSVLIMFGLLGFGCAKGPNMVPNNAKSPHFETVSEHLELGGEVYLYTDITQEVETLAEMLGKLLEETRKTDTGKEIPKIDFSELFATLGLDNIDAVGLSSYRRGKSFHNKAFIYIEGERRGMMKISGGDAHPFTVTQMAPEDSDIVFEGDANLKALYDLIVALYKQYAPDGGSNEILSNLSKPMSPLDISLEDVLTQMDTRFFGVMRLHDEQTIRIPEAEVTIPFVDFVLGADQIGFVADAVAKLSETIPLVKATVQQNLIVIEPTIPMMGPLAGYKPVIIGNRETNQFFIASSLNYFKKCVSSQSSIANTKDFEHAMFGLPQMGNSLGFASSHFKQQVTKTVATLAAHPDEMVQISGRLTEFLMLGNSEPEGSVSQNKDNGIFAASNSSSSHKSTLMTVAMANPVMIGVVGAMAIPSFMRYKNRAKTTEATMMLDQCAEGSMAYYNNHKKLPTAVDWTPVVPPNDTKFPFSPGYWMEPPWSDLGFMPQTDHYYRYRYVVEGNRVMCQAQGDLDGDGEFSLFEKAGQIVNKELRFDPSITKQNPLE